MDGFDKLHAEQDAFIKGIFQEDKIVSQPVLDSFESYLEKTKIKADRYTHKQKRIIFILIVLLLISVAYNVYLTINPEANIFGNKKQPEQSSPTHIIIDKTSNESADIDEVIRVDTTNEVANETNTSANEVTNEVTNEVANEVANEVSNTVTNEVENTVANNVAQATVTKKPTVEKDYSNEVNLEELAETLESYALGINRITDDEKNLESNTILLTIAKEYFNSHANDTGLSVGTKYTQTVENMHKFLTELTGRKFTSKYLDSYANFIGYAERTKSYLYGNDVQTLFKEEYKCSDLKVSDKSNDKYTATFKMTRTLDYIDTVYDVVVEFKVNEEYTYQKFCILSLKAKNTSFYPDNTVHFVAQ